MCIFNSFNDIKIYIHVNFQVKFFFQFYGDGTIQINVLNKIPFQISTAWIPSRCFKKQTSQYSIIFRAGFPLRDPSASSTTVSPVVCCIDCDAFAMDY